MNTVELEKRARSMLADTVGDDTTRYWSGSDLIEDYANDARNKLFLKVRSFIIDSTTANDLSNLPLCRLPVLANTAEYALSQKIIEIQRIRLASGTKPLIKIMRSELDELAGDWETADAAEPWGYCPDLTTDSIVLLPKPLVATTATITVSRFPLKRLVHGVPDDLGFREEYHDELLNWIAHRAFLKNDSEVKNSALAEEYRVKFFDRIDAIRQEVDRRIETSRTNIPRQAFRTH